ncbi:unnamed protein product [Sphagnum jensenii]|uniref:Uncharacterized protein n=1 Tax=Sphagnum jensenii TaxID=128206 RepID=A0ABP0VCK1_9BRYO
MKFLIFQEKDTEVKIPYVIAFDEAFVHRDVARTVGRGSDGRGFYVVSAGFFYRDASNGQICVTDQKSESMHMGPRPEDQTILMMALDHCMSGLDLLNHLTLMELQGLKRGDTRKHQ